MDEAVDDARVQSVQSKKPQKLKEHTRTEPSTSTSEAGDDASPAKVRLKASKNKLQSKRALPMCSVSALSSSASSLDLLPPTQQSTPINPRRAKKRVVRAKVTRRNDSTTQEEDDVVPLESPPKNPRSGRTLARRVKNNFTFDTEEDDSEPKPKSRRRKKKVVTDQDTARPVRRVRRRRRRVVMQLRPVRTEWPLVNGKDPLVEEILAEIPSPRNPRDPARYEIPKRQKKPSSADLLFDAYLAECAASNPPPSPASPAPTPTPPPTPKRRWASLREDLSEDSDSDEVEWFRDKFSWLTPVM